MAIAVPPTQNRRAARFRGRPVNRWALLAIPALALILVAFAYPVFDILRRSFTEPVAGLSNYRLFFDTPAYVTILRRTFVTATIVTAVCLLLGYPYAYLMTVVKRRWMIVLLAVVLVPFWTSLMVRTYAWIVLLQDTGVVNDLLAAVGIGRVSLIRNITGVTIGMTQVLLPFMVLPLYSTMKGIDRRLLHAAEGLGAPPRTAFWRIYVPLSMPGVTAGVTLVFILALGFYVTPALLGSPQNALLSQLVVQQVSQLLNFGMGGAMAAILLAATILLFAVVSRVIRPSRAFAALGSDS